MSLRVKTFSAIRWTASAAFFRIIVRLLQVAIMARLLAKEDFGLMAMALVVIDFASIFSDLGLNSAFMFSRDVTNNERSSLFWANVLSGAFFTLLTASLSGIFANYVYDEPRLMPIIISISPLFLINAFGVQLKTSAEKDLNFKRITYIELLTGFFGLALSVVLAKQGFGVYALVASSVLSSLVCTIFYWTLLSYDWRPTWWLKINEVRRFIGFGGAVVANNIVSQFNLSLDVVLGGKLLGAAQLGLYSIPRNLVLQIQFTINPVISRVGFPLIAKIQHDLKKVKMTYLKTVATTSSITAPLYVGMSFYANEVVHVLLGSGWSRTADLLRVIALWGGIRSLTNPIGSLLLGMGRADLQLKWNIGMFFIAPPILLFGFYVIPQSGWCDAMTGMVYALLLFVTLVYVPVWYFLVRPLCHATFWEYAVATLKPFGVSVVAILPTFIIYTVFGHQNLFVFFGCTAWSIVNYILISMKFNREWVDSVKELFRGVTAASP